MQKECRTGRNRKKRESGYHDTEVCRVSEKNEWRKWRERERK